MPKPEILIPYLRDLAVDVDATRSFDAMSGGFQWSDEWPENYSETSTDYAMRFLLGYRASLIRGQPAENLRSVWETVFAACPGWPGFRPERCSPALAEELNESVKASTRYFNRLP